MPDQKPAWERYKTRSKIAENEGLLVAALHHMHHAMFLAENEIARLNAADSGNLNPERLEDKE